MVRSTKCVCLCVCDGIHTFTCSNTSKGVGLVRCMNGRHWTVPVEDTSLGFGGEGAEAISIRVGGLAVQLGEV